MYFNMDIKRKKMIEFKNSVVHNHRKEKNPKDNIDYDRSANNYYIYGSSNEYETLISKIKETEESRKLQNGKIKKIRSDSNVCLSFVFSASPQFFFDFAKSNMTIEKWNSIDIEKSKEQKKLIAEVWKTLDEEKSKEFEKIILEHLKEVHGNNLINVMCHRDEKGLHYHALVCPRTESENGLKLSCKDYYRNYTLAGWNKDIRKRMKTLGLSANKPESDPPLSVEEHELNEVEPPPQQEPRPPAVQVNKGLFGYKSEEVEKQIKSSRRRENALKIENQKLRTYIEENSYEYSQSKIVKKRYDKLKRSYENMKTKYVKLTEEKKEELRTIPVAELLSQLGYQSKKEGTTVRFKNDDFNIVVKPSTNHFIDNKSMIGGYGAIDLLTKVLKFKFIEAVEYLSNRFSSNEIASLVMRNEEETKKLVSEKIDSINVELPKRGNDRNIENVKYYLINERKIQPKIVEYLISQNLLYADKRNNCVFTNEKNTFAYVRGTVKGKRFVANKGNVDFLKYDFESENSNEIFLFESAIDAFSFRTKTGKSGTYVVLNGSGMINRIEELNIGNYKKLNLCFDNDDQGKAFCDKIIDRFKTIDIQVFKPHSKDFNEDIQNGNSAEYEPIRITSNRNSAVREEFKRKTGKIKPNT